MARPLPPNIASSPAATMTLGQMSAAGTTAGAPAAQVDMGPPPGSGLPGSGPTPVNPTPDVPPDSTPQSPMGGNQRPVVGSHATKRSVGTHPSRSPKKRGNPVHGHAK